MNLTSQKQVGNAGIVPSLANQIVALRQRIQETQRLLESTKELGDNSNNDFADDTLAREYSMRLEESISNEEQAPIERGQAKCKSKVDQAIIQKAPKRQRQSKPTKECLEH